MAGYESDVGLNLQDGLQPKPVIGLRLLNTAAPVGLERYASKDHWLTVSANSTVGKGPMMLGGIKTKPRLEY